MVVLPYCDRLLLLSRYLQQLVMESVGKRFDRQGQEVHQGLTVYGNKGSTDQHAFVQQLRDGRDDFFATFVQVLGDGGGSSLEVESGINAGDTLQGFLLGTRNALAENGRPSLTVTIPSLNAYVLGGLIALFERTVSFYATLIDVNAYHQPGVESGKRAAMVALQLSRRIRELTSLKSLSLQDLVEATGGDPMDVFDIAERLVTTNRLVGEGSPDSRRYTRLIHGVR
jgi:glucose-6-phosphate isomerase